MIDLLLGFIIPDDFVSDEGEAKDLEATVPWKYSFWSCAQANSIRPSFCSSRRSAGLKGRATITQVPSSRALCSPICFQAL